MSTSKSGPNGRHGESATEVFGAFLRLGLTSFGGPAAHLGDFRAEFVERRRWLDEPAYADVVGLCQFLPGPASSQTGFAFGLMHAGRTRGLGRLHAALGGAAGGVRIGCREPLGLARRRRTATGPEACRGGDRGPGRVEHSGRSGEIIRSRPTSPPPPRWPSKLGFAWSPSSAMRKRIRGPSGGKSSSAERRRGTARSAVEEATSLRRTHLIALWIGSTQ